MYKLLLNFLDMGLLLDFNDFINLSNISSIVIGLSGIFIGVYFYNKRKKIKKPVFLKKTTELLPIDSLSIDKIGFTYDEKKVEKLSVTKLAFWNEGRDTIRKADIVKKAPLVIATHEEIELYDYSVEILNSDNNIIITEIENCLHIEFDFLDQFDGFVLTIFHNGNNKKNVTPIGSFIGAKSIEQGSPKLKSFDWFAVFWGHNVFGRILTRIESKIIKIVLIIPIVIFLVLLFIISVVPLLIIGLLHDFFVNDTPKIYRLEN